TRGSCNASTVICRPRCCAASSRHLRSPVKTSTRWLSPCEGPLPKRWPSYCSSWPPDITQLPNGSRHETVDERFAAAVSTVELHLRRARARRRDRYERICGGGLQLEKRGGARL